MTAAPTEAPEGFPERNADRFAQARALCTEGQMVCGTIAEDGEPRYFIMPSTATNEEIEKRAFEVRNGRPMNQAEEILSREARIRGKL
jgi:hypothetical protein